ncbi:WbqC-like protein family protein [Pseudobutyrivibrio sp. UC1225]|uniref:WbqC family protein n=1 Tax=Pseudobutyrivibrio sp. UC1225 TaxID=1798185 RepID=UPI0008E38C92|nr:WbqC family protein [Pseudobutyrivibrio sp. UC1225]SFO24823.1 WbqC-like protein family protein [Pseudobutyrivibrio sp. UC1225]
MKLGINQPYFFPYIGYWQLINAVDEFVLADNLNFIKQGYINRNKVLINKEPQYFRLPVHKPSQNRLINEHETALTEEEIEKMLHTLQCEYRHAPNFERVYEHVKQVLEFGLTEEGKNLAAFLENAIKLTARELGITTPIKSASTDVILDRDYKRENYVIATCKKLGGTEYYNPIGGTKLYFQDFFRANGVGLKFVKANPDIKYEQFGNEFVPSLSIIDIMMFCSKEQIAEMLNDYELVDGYESPADIVEE